MCKKAVSLFLILSVVFSVGMMPTVNATELTDNYIWIEAENYVEAESEVGNYAEMSSPIYSGDKLLHIKSADQYNAELNNKLVYAFNANTATDYEIYVLASNGASEWFCNFMWQVNEGEAAYVIPGGTDVVHQSFEDQASGWQKAGEVSLNAGENTLTITCPTPAQASGKYFHIIDAIVVVPKAWSWAPSANVTARPKSVVAGTIVIEAEDYDVATSSAANYVVAQTGACSGNKYVYINKYNMNLDVENVLSYKFNADFEGEYNIFLLTSDGLNEWFSNYLWSVNGSTPAFAQNAIGAAVHAPFEGQGCGWQKVGCSYLNEGENTLAVSCPNPSPSGGSFFHVIDLIMIVPKSSNWTPEASIWTRPYLKTGYIWLEAENYDVKTSSADNYFKPVEGVASGSKLLYLDNSQHNAEIENKLVYSFETPVDDTYDIFMLSSDGLSLWFSQWQWFINNDMPATAEKTVSVNQVYPSFQGQPVAWQKAGTAEIGKGLNTLTVTCNDPSYYNTSYFHIIDAIVIVPSSWNWTPEDTTATRPVIPANPIFVANKELAVSDDDASVNGVVDFINYGDTDKKALMIAVKYDGDRMEKVYIYNNVIPKEDGYTFVSGDFENSDVNDIKLFVWDTDINTLSPIMGPVVF